MKPSGSTEEIFAAASALTDPNARLAYLDRVCAGHPRLREEVERLLAAAGRAGTFLDSPAAGITEVLREVHEAGGVPLAEQAGSRIGRYRLLEPIGEGGFGVVWMAEQEEPVRRRVALKIIKPGMNTREVVARFEAERQALAMMDHPNIARVLDAGTIDASNSQLSTPHSPLLLGRPYFVMELVKGIPITRFCDERRLSTRPRLELFMQVGHAVQHAHQKGIIHRDLKPSNILVTVQDDRPVPKVIDFGVAKATQARLTDKTLFTRFHQLIGTPAYMSPEQAGLGSLDVDTRSDVYALGVLLYELLTGRTPFETERLLAAGYEAMMRTIREEEPPKPSTRLSTLDDAERNAVADRRQAKPDKLDRSVRGDLDWIVMKALEKDRTRRYDTAASLVQDVERHLRGEPIAAAAPSVSYRLAKFVRRNRVVVGTVLVIAVTLVLATGISLRSAWVARRERVAADAARAEAADAQRAEAVQRTIAESTAQESQQRLARLNTAQGVQLMDRGDWLGAALWFSDALRLTGPHEAAEAANRLRLGVILAYVPRLVRLWSHAGPVNRASFSPDGQWVLTAAQDGQARLWDLANDQPVGAAMRHAAPVRDAEFSRDGRYVVTTCEDRTARVWEAASGKVVSPPLVHPLPLCRAWFSRDGRHVFTASSRDQYSFSWSDAGEIEFKMRREQSEIRIWDTLSGRELPSNYRRNSPLVQVLPSPSGRWVAVAYADGEVCLLDEGLHLDRRLGDWSGVPVTEMKTVSPVIQLGPPQDPPEFKMPGEEKLVWHPAHAGRIHALAFRLDERYLATAASDGSVVLWDLERTRLLRSLRAAGELAAGPGRQILQMAFSPEGQRLLVLTKDGTVAFWSVPAGEAAGQLAAPIAGSSSVVFSPDGRRVAVLRATSGIGEARVWDVANGQPVSPALPHAGAVTSASFGPDGNLLLTAGFDGSARVWNLASCVPSIPPLLDLRSPIPATKDDVRSADVLDAFFNRDGDRLVTLERGRVARLWDTAAGLPVAPGIKHGLEMPTAAFSHDGERLAIAGFGEIHQARIYGTTTGQAATPVLAHANLVQRVAFSPDDRWLIASHEGGVCLWDAASGAPVPLPLRGVEALRDLVFSSDGQWIATCAGTSSALHLRGVWQVQIWRAATGEAIAAARPVAGTQPQLVFSPDGRWLAVGTRVSAEMISDSPLQGSARVHILDVRNGGASGRPVELPEPGFGLRFSADSARLFLLGGGSGKLTVWDVARGEAIAGQQPRDHEYRPREVGWEGRWLLGSAQGGWRLWETASGEPLTPVLGGGLGDPFPSGKECLVPGARAVLARGAAALQLWALRPDQRPLVELSRHVQLLAARELDAWGSLAPLPPARLSNLWHTVRSALPEVSSVGTNQVALWHLQEAAQSEAEGQWSAAEFHFSRLPGTPLDGPQTRQRLARARTQAAIELLKRNP